MSNNRIAENAVAPPEEQPQGDWDDQKLWGRPLNFRIPPRATDVEQTLAKDIVKLDHRSIWTLRASPERGEIWRLIYNVIGFLGQRQPEVARQLLDHAEAVYHQHIQAKNRLRYLAGMLAGIAVIAGFGAILTSFKQDPVIPATTVPMILLFAGMGCITSVLTRLSSIDLRDQTSLWLIFISGMARPVTAIFFAIVIYLLLSLRIVDFHIGAGTDPAPPSLFLVAAFMSGFSERFAQDILTKLGGVVSASDPQPEPSTQTAIPSANSAPDATAALTKLEH
jgi:hypothetical protein